MSKIEIHNSDLINELFDSIDSKEIERTKQKMLLAAKIEDAMKAKGWRKTDLIKALDIRSPSIVTRWFSGTHNFNTDTLIDLQTVLEVNLLNVGEEYVKPVNSYHFCLEYRVEVGQQSSFMKNMWSDYSNAQSVFSSNSVFSKIAEA